MHFARATLLAAAVALASCSGPLDWREFRWDEGGFSVLLPGKPDKNTRAVKIGERSVEMTLFAKRIGQQLNARATASSRTSTRKRRRAASSRSTAIRVWSSRPRAHARARRS
jgi:hypothetical protein